MRTKGTAQSLEDRRRLAVQRVQDGYRPVDVARFLGVHIRTVHRWLAAFRADGKHALAARPHLGRAYKLTLDQDLEVLSWLFCRPTSFGFATDLWTAGRLACLIERKFGVRYHPRYLCAWLRRRGASPQKPQGQPRERDQERIDRWVAQDWSAIQQQALQEDAALVLIDESGLFLDPLVRRTWALRGHTPIYPTHGAHRQKVSVIGALAFCPRAQRLGLHFRTLANGYFNNVQVADFLEELVQQLGGRVIVVWDGGSMHKGAPIRALAQRYPGLTLKRLPPYAPDLNPVEHLWNHIKYSQLANFVATSVWHLDAALTSQLEGVQQTPERLRRFWESSALPFPEILQTVPVALTG